MGNQHHFANILLSGDHPFGRMSAPKRKKGDWYHSVAVFADESINDLSIGANPIKCVVIHFFGHNGSPVLEKIDTYIRCTRKHIDKKLYILSAWDKSIGVVGDIRTKKGYEKGYGICCQPIDKIISTAFQKWGYERIPYSHQRNESYNCVAFVDDISIQASTGIWNKRIVDMHYVHGLYLE